MIIADIPKLHCGCLLVSCLAYSRDANTEMRDEQTINDLLRRLSREESHGG